MSLKVTAKQEITNFLQSKELGIRSTFSRTSLLNAAQDLFTANGHVCPVIIKELKGETYLVNRDILAQTNPSDPALTNDA